MTEIQLPAVKILIEDLIDEEFLNEHFDHVVELNKVILKEHGKRESVIDPEDQGREREYKVPVGHNR